MIFKHCDCGYEMYRDFFEALFDFIVTKDVEKLNEKSFDS